MNRDDVRPEIDRRIVMTPKRSVMPASKHTATHGSAAITPLERYDAKMKGPYNATHHAAGLGLHPAKPPTLPHPLGRAIDYGYSDYLDYLDSAAGLSAPATAPV